MEEIKDLKKFKRIKPLGLPRFVTDYEINDLRNLEEKAIGKDSANAFMLGEEQVSETIEGPYEVYSSALQRNIRMDGPEVTSYRAVQFYRI